MSRATKEGIINIDKKSVTAAVEQVMRFLFMGKSDSRGELKEVSKAKVKRDFSNSPITSTDIELENFLGGRLLETVTIVCITNFKMSGVFKCDLKLTSRDINSSDYSVQLATCLTLDSPRMYIDCSNLNKRGQVRLQDMLKKMKILFDSRVCVILVSEASISEDLKQVSERDFSTFEIPVKKFKIASATNLLEPEKAGESETLIVEKNKLEMSINILKKEHASLLKNNKSLHDENVTLNNLIEKVKLENCQLQQDVDNLVVKSETMKNEGITVENLKAVVEQLKVSSSSLETEKDYKEAEIDGLKLINDSLIANAKNMQIELGKFKNESDSLKAELSIMKVDKESWIKKREGLDELRDSLSVETESLKVVKESLRITRDSMETLRVEKEGLMEERDIFQVEKEKLKAENDSLKVDINNIKLSTKTLTKAPSGKGGNLCVDVDVNEKLKYLKQAVLENQQKMSSASSPEIVQRSIPTLHFESRTEGNTDSFTVSVTILKPECLYRHPELRAFEGKGTSRKAAKRKAFDNLIENILSFE